MLILDISLNFPNELISYLNLYTFPVPENTDLTMLCRRAAELIDIAQIFLFEKTYFLAIALETPRFISLRYKKRFRF